MTTYRAERKWATLKKVSAKQYSIALGYAGEFKAHTIQTTGTRQHAKTIIAGYLGNN